MSDTPTPTTLQKVLCSTPSVALHYFRRCFWELLTKAFVCIALGLMCPATSLPNLHVVSLPKTCVSSIRRSSSPKLLDLDGCFGTQRAQRGISMPRGKNCRERIFAAQLPRKYPHCGGYFQKTLSCRGEAIWRAFKRRFGRG